MQAQTKTSSINIVTSTFYKPPTCNYRCSSILVKYAVDIQFNKTFTAVQLVFLISCKTFQRLCNFAFAQNGTVSAKFYNDDNRRLEKYVESKYH